MKTTKFKLPLLILVFVFACKKEVGDPPQINNKPPVAIAGPDINYSHPPDEALLYGRARDPDGYIKTYSWKKVAGPTSFYIANPEQAVTKVRKLDYGIYKFELKVTDNGGLSGTSSVIITVGCDPGADGWSYL